MGGREGECAAAGVGAAQVASEGDDEGDDALLDCQLHVTPIFTFAGTSNRPGYFFHALGIRMVPPDLNRGHPTPRRSYNEFPWCTRTMVKNKFLVVDSILFRTVQWRVHQAYVH